MRWRTVRRTASVLGSLLRQEIKTISQYRWWLLAMQASTVTTSLISVLVWRGAIDAGVEPPVTRSYLTTYLLVVGLVTMLTSSWTARFLADSIRLGHLSAWLVRPCSTHLAAVANNVAEKLAKVATLVPLILALALPFHSELVLPTHLGRWLLFLWTVVLGATLIFSFDVIIGSLAFWWADVTAVDRFRQLATLFLSGALIPLSVMPAAWGPFLAVQPFGYAVAFPIQALLASDLTDLRVGLTLQGAWVLLALGAARFTWRRGLRRYSGAGA